MRAHRRALAKRARAQELRDEQARYEYRIAQIEDLLAESQGEEKLLREALQARLIESYKEGPNSSWQVVLGGGGISETLERAKLVDAQAARDTRLALDHQVSMERLEEVRSLLEQLRDEQGAQATHLETQANTLDEQLVSAADAHVEDEPKLRKNAGVSGTWLFAPGDDSSLLSMPWSAFPGQVGGAYDGGSSTPPRPATPMQIVAILNDPRISIYAGGQADIRAGRIDGRVVDALRALADHFHSVNVTSLRSGHPINTASGNLSMHTLGCAVDIGSLNGIVIQPSTQGPGSITEQGVKFLAGLQGDLAPHQVISLNSYGGPTLAMADHHDHIHLGYSC